MGLESVNLQFVPQPMRAGLLETALREHGAEVVPTYSRFAHYKLRGPDFYLDIQVGHFADLAQRSASVRMALCNPPEAERRLYALLSHLLARCGGYIVAPKLHRRVADLDEEGSRLLAASIQAARERFQSYFGKWQAPLAAEEVMAHYRKISGKMP